MTEHVQSAAPHAVRMAGGLNEEHPVTPEIQELVNGVKDEIKSKLTSKPNADLSDLKAISYRSQVVAGTNYFIKVWTF
jgi:cystatin-A/B